MLAMKSAHDFLLGIPVWLSNMQGSTAARNKIDVLSRIVALEQSFNSRPGNVAEQRRRDELLRYVAIPPLCLAALTFF
jgi:hypothetical protein